VLVGRLLRGGRVLLDRSRRRHPPVPGRRLGHPADGDDPPLSAGTVKYGAEQGEKLSVKVTPAYAGPATGSVTVSAGATVLCRITLTSGSGSCKLGARQLAPGTHGVVAKYAGATYFASATSASKTLKITA
jgi:hypothetical protein